MSLTELGELLRIGVLINERLDHVLGHASDALGVALDENLEGDVGVPHAVAQETVLAHALLELPVQLAWGIPHTS